MQIFKLVKQVNGVSLETRMQAYTQFTDDALDELYSEQLSPPLHLVHVTCTGYTAPSCAHRLVQKKGWCQTTLVTHLYHMGCYAALPAIRLALNEVKFTQSCDIVHTECCSLHFQPALHTPEQMVIQSLFGDGYISYQVASEAPKEQAYFEIFGVHEELIAQSTNEMKWECANDAFQMSLSATVPIQIQLLIEPFLERLASKVGLDFRQIQPNSVFAIHPGGPKIIESLADKLKLLPWQYLHSVDVLYEYGNMSSATLPHIWQKILLSSFPTLESPYIISLAFGPGLTLAGAIFRKHGS
jgi:predicted naringenin-chalcone synthase